MAPKRKARESTGKSNKKSRKLSTRGGPGKYYEARAILEEDEKRYRIDWKDDPDTGEQYDPTWEPKENANQSLVKSWEEEKASHAQLLPTSSVESSESIRPKYRPSRRRKLPESSPLTQRQSSPASQARRPPRRKVITPDSEPEPEIQESEPERSPLFVGNTPRKDSKREPAKPRKIAIVQVNEPTSSYRAGEYLRFASSDLQFELEYKRSAVTEEVQDGAGSQASRIEHSRAEEHITQITTSNDTSERVVPDSQETPKEQEGSQVSGHKGSAPQPDPQAESPVQTKTIPTARPSPGGSSRELVQQELESPVQLEAPSVLLEQASEPWEQVEVAIDTQPQEQQVEVEQVAQSTISGITTSEKAAARQLSQAPETSAFIEQEQSKNPSPSTAKKLKETETTVRDKITTVAKLQTHNEPAPRPEDQQGRAVNPPLPVDLQPEAPPSAIKEPASTTQGQEDASRQADASTQSSQIDPLTAQTQGFCRSPSLQPHARARDVSTQASEESIQEPFAKALIGDSRGGEQRSRDISETELGNVLGVDSTFRSGVIEAVDSDQYATNHGAPQAGETLENTAATSEEVPAYPTEGIEPEQTPESTQRPEHCPAEEPIQKTLAGEEQPKGQREQSPGETFGDKEQSSETSHKTQSDTAAPQEPKAFAQAISLGALQPEVSQATQRETSANQGSEDAYNLWATNGPLVIEIQSSESLDSSSQFLTQPDYELPPAGQRLPQSLIASTNQLPSAPKVSNRSTSIGRESLSAPAVRGLTQEEPSSSFPFNTQVSLNSAPKATHDQICPSPSFSRDQYPTTPNGRETLASPSSSRLCSPPSQTLGIFGESAPSPIGTISSTQSPAMSSKKTFKLPKFDINKNDNGPSVDDILRRRREEHARAKAKAKEEKEAAPRSTTPVMPRERPVSSLPADIRAEINAARAAPFPPLPDGARSPSVVPAVEPTPVITREEMNTSERYDTLLPRAQDSEAETISQGPLASAGATKHFREPHDGPEMANVHVVPTPMSGHQRDQYLGNIWHQDETIKMFLETRNPTSRQLDDAEALLERFRSIAMHTDLVNLDTLTQVSTAERQANWDIHASSKFAFLKEFLDKLKNRKTHIAIVARGPRLPDMLATFLEGIDIPHSRIKSLEDARDNYQGRHVTILDLDIERNIKQVEGTEFDLVLAMDGAVDVQIPLIRAARRYCRPNHDPADTGSWAVLLLLAVPKTIEHFERCLVTTLSVEARARLLLSASTKLKSGAGRIEEDMGQLSLKDAAEAVANFLKSSGNVDWPLAGLGSIDELDSQTDSDLDLTSSEVLSLLPQENNTMKRPFEALDSPSPDELTKRKRIESAFQIPQTINPQDIEVTHISDSIGKSTQSNVELSQQQTLEDLKVTRDQLAEHVRALEDLQYRYEEQRKDLVQQTKLKKDFEAQHQAALGRVTQINPTLTALRLERTELKQQLEEANNQLLDHSVPERREYEALRAGARTAEQEAEKARKATVAAEERLEFLRSTYQDSSNTCRQLMEEKAELEKRLAIAERQASGEAASVRQISQNHQTKALERENAKLRNMLKDRDAALKFKDEEVARLKESTRGRIGTRNSSVPRSPRLGSPIKAGRGSRQPSPSTGELGGRTKGAHPLRNG